MAENKDNSRAELFEILNELHNDDTPEADKEKTTSEGADAETRFESESRVEELIKILSSDKPYGDAEELDEPTVVISDENAENTEEATESEDSIEEDLELPEALFSHLSDETQSIITPELSSHFTDEPTVPAEATEEADSEDESDDEDEEYEDENTDSMVKKVGKFFRGMSFIPKAAIYVVLVLMVSAYLAYYVITIGNDVFALVTDSKEVTIVIEEGDTTEEIAQLLKDKGVIKYAWVYEMYMKYRGDGDSEDVYIVGEHVLNQNFNYSQIITALTSSKREREIKRITIPEGYTVEQIITLLVDNGIGERGDYIEAINNYPYKWDFVQQLETLGYSADRKYRLEGYLYPDTYEFSTTEDEVYVINKMLNAFNDKFWREYIREDEDGFSLSKHMMSEYNMTFDDVIVFASIVQSEGGTAEDFYYVSHVFHNRLDNPGFETNGKLESDATIQYVLPQRVDAEKVDTTYDTPYNTYTYKGLTPGAICNPGTDALSATLYPERPKDDNGNEFKAYYFVANKAGKTYYAYNESGHNANKRKVERDNEKIEAGTYEG